MNQNRIPVVNMVPTSLFGTVIGETQYEGSEREALIDPATGASWGQVAWDPDLVDLAVTEARKGLPSWRSVSATQKADIFDRIADAIAHHVDELAAYETLANGKPLHFTRAEVKVSASWWKYYSALLRTMRGETLTLGETKHAVLTHEPVGVVGLITPFNGAFSLGIWKLAPALAGGNSVIIKPPVNSPASSILLQRILREAGVPIGTVHIVQGSAEVGQRLVSHPGVDMISFTGSTSAARQVGSIVSGRLARFVAEAGGKSAHIIFDDADIEQALTAVVQGGFSASGQTCVAGSRVLLHKDIAKTFTERLLERVSKLVVGDPGSADSHIGPIASASQYRRILHLIEKATEDGAEVLTGGMKPPALPPELSQGFWVLPTVLRVRDSDASICHTEVFGPVITLIEFEDEEEAISIANNSEFGLAAGFWTQSPSRTQRVASQLEAGTVWVNTYRGMDWQTPFGGVKQSGIGRENGIEGLREFQNVKAIVQEFGVAADPFGIA